MTSGLASRWRHRFPIFERLTYVNSCSQGALSDAVRDAYARYLVDWETLGSPWDIWVGKVEEARAEFAALVAGEPDDVAVTTSLSAGLNSLVSGLDFGTRSKVVLTDLEFPTVGQIWHAQERRGAQIVHVAPGADGLVPLERFDEAIDETTLIVSIAHVSYRTGARIDVEAVAELAHERGALVFLDAYQTAGSLPLHVGSLGVDALCAGTVKYLLGSAGLAFLWCRPDLVERVVPTVTGWFADEDVDAMDVSDYSPSPTARRFETGTPPVPALYAGTAALELIAQIGVAETETHVEALGEQLVAGVEELGGRVVTPSFRGALICIRATDEQALVRALAEEGVVTSSRDGNLRVSLHAYNTRDDVDAVLAALGRHRELLT
jgi:selenocysteine lyase/cysteine desulfurase